MEKDISDYNGTESYIAKKFKKQDISWFPIERALCLDYAVEVDEMKEREKFKEFLGVVEHRWDHLLKKRLEEREDY